MWAKVKEKVFRSCDHNNVNANFFLLMAQSELIFSFFFFFFFMSLTDKTFFFLVCEIFIAAAVRC